MDVKLPIDLPQRPPYRSLRDSFIPPSAAFATHTYYVLFQELNYSARAGVRPGLLPKLAIASFAESLASGGILDQPAVGTREQVFEKLMDRMINPIGLLVKQGDDFYCPEFAEANPEVIFRSRNQQGGDLRGYYHRTKNMGERIMQKTLGLAPDIFKDADGRPLDHPRTERLQKLIILCDCALYLKDREPFAYGEALIQNGLAVLEKYPGDLGNQQIEAACKKIAKNRNHPILSGIATEKLLADFDAFVERLP